MIEAQNISKQFDGFWALENVSCRIERGSIYGMVGSNGAGKSTFLRILSGIYRPNSGTVSLDGAPLYQRTRTGFTALTARRFTKTRRQKRKLPLCRTRFIFLPVRPLRA